MQFKTLMAWKKMNIEIQPLLCSFCVITSLCGQVTSTKFNEMQVIQKRIEPDLKNFLWM